MTDPIREAFERWRDTKPHMSPLSVWQAAWKQSRREALMEAARMCETLIVNEQGIGRRAIDGDWCAEAIRAAAEEEGK